MLNIAIVEDERAAADVLSEYINRYCAEKHAAANVVVFSDAMSLLSGYKPVYDIIFMDIMLPGMNGMDAAKKLRKADGSAIIVFVTNMANFAVRGYEVNALDFIIKPLIYDSFAMKMNKAVSAALGRRRRTICIQTDGVTKIVDITRIRYVEVSRHYLVYHTELGNYRARGTLGEAEKQLGNESFARCNVCYLVNMRFVSEIDGENLTVGGDILKISRARKKQFMNALANYLGQNV